MSPVGSWLFCRISLSRTCVLSLFLLRAACEPRSFVAGEKLYKRNYTLSHVSLPHLYSCLKYFSQVFQTLHSTGQSSMVRDWVMLSLSNFTQRTPVAMAMWSLSCFFVSASTSQWISAMYPKKTERVLFLGKYSDSVKHIDSLEG